jgi:hypothetical protein
MTGGEVRLLLAVFSFWGLNRGQNLSYPHKIAIKNSDLGIKRIGWTRMAFFDLVLGAETNIRKTPCVPPGYLITFWANTVKGYIRSE